MFKNLKAEFARKGVSASGEISKILGCTDRSIRNKLAGKTSLSVREAEMIKNHFFPHLTIDYLFATDDQPTQKTEEDATKKLIELLKRENN